MTHPSMRERMARAMATADGSLCFVRRDRERDLTTRLAYSNACGKYFIRAAAALQTLLEPDRAMIEAGMDCVVGCCSPDQQNAREIFTAMIRAALKGSEK